MPRYSNLPYIGPPRSYSGQQTKYGITVHSTENVNASARDEAGYATRRTDGTSSHYYVDNTEVVQSLNTDYGANHAGSWWPNQHCVSYEFCGAASWSTSKWMSSINWEAAAKQIAVDCARWSIPADWLTVSELSGHQRGFNTHNDCRLAFGGTTHTDPGPNFPKSHLLTLVKGYLNGDDMPTADEVATAVYKKFTHKVPENSWAVANGYMTAGATITPHTALRQAWSYGKAGFQSDAQIAAELVSMQGQITGLVKLVQQLLAADPVDLTPEQYAALLTAVSEAAAKPGNELLARVAAAGDALDGDA